MSLPQGILSAVAKWHRDNPALCALIPAANVLSGEPSPGMGLPAVAYREASRNSAGGTSKARFRAIVVTAEAEAEESVVLERFAEALESAMTGWQSAVYRTVGPADVQATISRDPTSASEHYRATIRLAWTASAAK